VRRKLIIRSTARHEIDQQAYYLSESAGDVIALRFLSAVSETFAAILEHPAAGRPWVSGHSLLEGIRRHRVLGFAKFLLFYRYNDESLEILHLYHGAQDIEANLQSDAEE
jgi:toxin ParE1/3/4